MEVSSCQVKRRKDINKLRMIQINILKNIYEIVMYCIYRLIYKTTRQKVTVIRN